MKSTEPKSTRKNGKYDTKFTWRDHWYPVSLIEDLDPSETYSVSAMGRDIVLWKDRATGEWVALDDKCLIDWLPYRIDEEGHLQCSYHGWSFDRCGTSTRIPQAASEGPEARAVKSPRACATKLLLWYLRVPDDFESPEYSTVTHPKEICYTAMTRHEQNVSDPSHIDFVITKMVNQCCLGRNIWMSCNFSLGPQAGEDRAKPLAFQIGRQRSLGIRWSHAGNPKISAKFMRPATYLNKIEIDTKHSCPVGDQKWANGFVHSNCTDGSRETRSIVCSARNFIQLTLPGPAWWQIVPRWHEHWTSNKVYDGDMIVLQGQEKIFLSKSKEGSTDVNKEYTKLTFTPTQADRFVLAFRNWLRRHGNSQPEWYGTSIGLPPPSTILSKRQMLDSYWNTSRHQTESNSCSTRPHQRRPCIHLQRTAENFIFVDYVHSEID
ncbi:unnamed protein product [Rhodiola kirilowii]